MFNFDSCQNRKNTSSEKWDGLERLYGRDDLIPMWVADMDFGVAPAITQAFKNRISHDVYGYTFPSEEYYNAVINWMKRRHNWDIKKEWITYTPGVVSALSYAVRAFTKPGDKVIIQTPVYRPFYGVIGDNDRQLVANPLIYKDGKYYMDYEGLENIIDSNTRMLILCSPHNPVGRVWTKEELKKLSDICIKHNILIVSDEIHFDLVYKGNEHTVFANVSEEAMDNSIILTAPSKTFNIAGLQVSNIIISNEELREKFRKQTQIDHISSPNIFGIEALIAAYNESEEWLDELLVYLEGNRDYFIEYINTKIPKLKVLKPEGTYLMWVDCSGLNMTPEELRDFFINKCRVALNDGRMFGEEGNLYQRFNIGCPRSMLEEGLNRVEKAINLI